MTCYDAMGWYVGYRVKKTPPDVVIEGKLPMDKVHTYILIEVVYSDKLNMGDWAISERAVSQAVLADTSPLLSQMPLKKKSLNSPTTRFVETYH
jgi:hypothetical protein